MLRLRLAPLLLLAACSSDPPLVRLQVTRGPGAPALSTLARFGVEVARCDDTAPTTRALDATAGSTTGLSLDLVPGTTFAVWLQGLARCPAAECRPFSGRAAEGLCTCGGPVAPMESLAIVASACTGWITASGGELDVPLVLTSTRGLCPTPLDRCPARDAGVR